MNRTEKEALVVQMQTIFKATTLVVLVHYSGLSVSESTDLRNQMREAGASYKVAKNRVVKRALAGTDFALLESHFSGPIGMAWSDDPVAAAKVAMNFGKTNKKLQIIVGCLNGEMLDSTQVKALAALPSLNELRGIIIGLVQAPASKVALVTQAPAAGLTRLVKAYGEKVA